MKICVKGSNSCMNRKTDLDMYRRYLEANGHRLVSDPEEADIVLLWCCAFRKDYRDYSLRAIEEALGLKGELIVCGCLPDIDPGLLSARFSGRAFSWRSQSSALPKLFGPETTPLERMRRRLAERPIQDLSRFRQEHPGSKVCFHDQFIKVFISEGCRCACTYCSEIRSMPPYRSFPLEQISAECRKVLSSTPERRVLFCGDSVGDYGKDIGLTLLDAMDAILAIGDDVQVGLSNFNPQHFMEYFGGLESLFRSGRIFFADICIQSASDRILALMGRRYVKADIERIFSMLNEIRFREAETDVIVGFPSESSGEFEETSEFLLRQRPKYVQLSGYADVPGAESARLPGKLPGDEVQRRVAVLRERLRAAGILFDSATDAVLKDWPQFRGGTEP